MSPPRSVRADGGTRSGPGTDARTDSHPDPSGERVVILNPASGSGDHGREVRDLSRAHGYDVHETESAGDAIGLARETVADGASLVAAAGGDGTVNEVVRGVVAADALDRVTLGVVPCGTGNDFAENVGVTGIAHAFEVLDGGERRRIDLGIADDRPFVNSCVGGLTAEASAETTPELKRRLGAVAYVLATLRTVPTFDGIRVSVEGFDEDGRSPVWSGDAVAVLVGNGRRFPPEGSTQANAEDGRLDVTLVHDVDSVDLMATAASERLLGRDTPHTTRCEVPALEIDVREGSPIPFSLDGEIVRRDRLSVHTRPRALRIAVGERYEPAPQG